MKRWSIGIAGSLVAWACGAAIDTEPAASPYKALVPTPQVAPAPVARPGTFAAHSVAFARRLAPEQREEWRFLKEAAAAGRFEHDAAKLALAKSGDAQVRSLAAALLNHHAGAQGALQKLLHVRSMAPPMLSNDQRKTLNRLARIQGAKFDREWMESVALRSQHESLQAFERAQAAARDPALRSWVERTVPTIRHQLAAAERVSGGARKFAGLAPAVPSSPQPASAHPHMATRAMGAAPAVMPNTSDLGEGNMLLGPARPVAVRLSEPGIR